MKFGTKAETIRKLYGRLTKAEVLPTAIFSVKQWKSDPKGVYERVQSVWRCDEELIVRSSAINEDLTNESMAGKFESVLHVKGKESFYGAVEHVLASYGTSGSPEDQFFVQPMLKNVSVSGVAFTMDPNTGGNYYVINYDDATGSTSSVTGGAGENLKTFYCFKGFTGETGQGRMDHVIQAAKELENLFGSQTLDIEFAMTGDDRLFILQVRPLVLKRQPKDLEGQRAILDRIHDYIKAADERKPYLCGKKAVYSVMTDWNPAEIIGIRPKQLSLSLYKNLITDGTWAYQRAEYGYKDLRGFPLLIDYGGLPYIDVRVSFNSFIPQDIDNTLAEKLVGYYLKRIQDNPSLHDKVEFDIIFSCNTFDLPQRIKILKDYGFTDTECGEIIRSLNKLTKRIINTNDGMWVIDSRKIDILRERQEMLINSQYNKIYKIYWLLEDCRRYGTLPFAGLARAGFIAVQILRSLVATGVFSPKDYNDYMASLNTVSSNMTADFANLSRQTFLKKYGHLRPGTYDINSPRYDEAPDRYFSWDRKMDTVSGPKDFRLSIQQMTRIKDYLINNDWTDDILVLFKFLKGAIEGREYSKFVFTKSLSYVLKLIEELGQEYGLSREDMAYADVEDIKTLYGSERDVATVLLQSVEAGKARYQDTKGLSMPPVITRAEDCYYFHIGETLPNYITLNKAYGPVRHVDDEDLEGAILFIPSADPGYDWVFSRKIAGFVTKYGGVNSHMAIRSGELAIPAIIGAGELLYERLSSAKTVEIDCALRKVEVIN